MVMVEEAPGMSVKPRRRRAPRSLGQLKGCLWAAIQYNTGLIEDEAAEPELRLKASTTLVQAALAYAKLLGPESPGSSGDRAQEVDDPNIITVHVRGQHGHHSL
jgi:hypothetical protein